MTVRRRRRILLLSAVVVVGVTAALLVRRLEQTERERVAASIPGAEVRAPQGTRIRVEVLNATPVRGLARRATRWLRDGGFDVVHLGTARERAETTLVIDRVGRPDWARLVADRLGGARIESRPDSSRYLDVTVLLGRTFRAPPQTFYP